MISEQIWEIPPARIELRETEIHIWRAALDLSPERIGELERTLSVDELDRARRFYFDKHRVHFVVCRGLLRLIISRYLQCAPGELSFCYNRYGKPRLDLESDDSDLEFNLSHSGGEALYAVTLHREIGVDIEHIHTDRDFEGIARAFFSPGERDVICGLPERSRYRAFFNCWTRKEAFIKALGVGISFPLDQFEVSLSNCEPARILSIYGDAEQAARWHLEELPVGSQFAAALCVEGPVGYIGRWQWNDCF